MFCPKCGEKIADESFYCPFCGSRIDEALRTQSVEAPEEKKTDGPEFPAPEVTYGASQKIGPVPDMKYTNDIYEPKRTNALAVAGFVLGLLSVVFSFAGIMPILGLIFSVVAMRKTADGSEKGRGLAVAGLVLSILGIAFGMISCAACSLMAGEMISG